MVAVVTVPDKPKGRGLKLAPSPVKQVALESGLTVLQPQKLRDPGFLNQLKTFAPDLIVVVAFRILPEEVFTLPPKGAVNLHGSLLPKYRGAAPVNWAIINGENKTGVTTFFIQKQVDTGNMIDQVEIPISENMTAGELHDIMAEVGAEVLVKTVHKIETGNVQTFVQDESGVTRAPKIRKEDCLTNFNRPANEVHNFIRGLCPYPAAFTYLNGKSIKLFESRLVDDTSKREAPGSILSDSDDEIIAVQCNPGIISIHEIQVQGKKRMSVADFLRGHPLSSGLKFESKD